MDFAVARLRYSVDTTFQANYCYITGIVNKSMKIKDVCNNVCMDRANVVFISSISQSPQSSIILSREGLWSLLS